MVLEDVGIAVVPLVIQRLGIRLQQTGHDGHVVGPLLCISLIIVEIIGIVDINLNGVYGCRLRVIILVITTGRHAEGQGQRCGKHHCIL